MWGLGEESKERLLVLSRLRVDSNIRSELEEENDNCEQRHWVGVQESELAKKMEGNMALVIRRNTIRKRVVGIV